MKVPILSLLAFLSILSAAQEPGTLQASGASLISAMGSATVEAVPDYVSFSIVRSITNTSSAPNPDLELAITEASGMQKKALKLLNEGGFPQFTVTFSGPSIVRLSAASVDVSLIVRFSVVSFQSAETGASDFALLCLKVRDFARALDAKLDEPVFEVSDPEIYESEAIIQATESAYPRGEAVARALLTSIVHVEHVEVGEVKWAQSAADSPSAAQQVDHRRIYCSAQVSMRYYSEVNTRN